MNLNWLNDNIVYVTLHGSQAYGLANELSDVDVKGICVPPSDVEYNLFQRFEQAENNKDIEEKFGHLKNPNNPIFESTIFSLRKFMVLAANVNPNIVELLWTDPSDHFVKEPLMDQLFDNRHLFLSSKAKFTFSGYAHSQLAKIQRHRKWIVMGELEPPKREAFDLPPAPSPGVSEVLGYIKSKVEQWNLNQYPLEEMDRNDLKETIWELIYELTNKYVGWDNWPDAYTAGVIHKMGDDLGLKEDVLRLITKEREFFKAQQNYKSWLRWKAERNPKRRELEVKSGYDTKHASHLVRLMRMGLEILETGKVVVKRPDREELLMIKNGGWTYEQVMEFAGDMQKKLDEAYKKTKLPKNVDFEKVNTLYHRIYQEYWHRKNVIGYVEKWSANGKRPPDGWDTVIYG
jgi:predicted nucleotidyltransferase